MTRYLNPGDNQVPISVLSQAATCCYQSNHSKVDSRD